MIKILLSPYIFLLLGVALLFSVNARADFADYHTAFESEVNEQLEPYGIECDFVRKGFYKIIDSIIQPPSIKLSCVKNVESPDTVNPDIDPASATITLSWNAPTTRADNSLLDSSEIGGYEIYMINNIDTVPIDKSITLAGNVTTYTTDKLGPGVYHFSISTYDTNNIYSEKSPAVTVEIN